jgi:hypothetical protein
MRKFNSSFGEISGQIRVRVAASFKTFLSIIKTSIACNVTGSDSTDSLVDGLHAECHFVCVQ